MGFSLDIKSVKHGDEYYSPQNVVDMIVPYVLRGGTRLFGALSTQRIAYTSRPSKNSAIRLITAI